MAGKKKKKKRKASTPKIEYVDIGAWIANSTDPTGPAWDMLKESLSEQFKSGSKGWAPDAIDLPIEDIMEHLGAGVAVLALTPPQVKEMEETAEYMYEKHLDWGTDDDYARAQSNFMEYLIDDPGERDVFALPRA